MRTIDLNRVAIFTRIVDAGGITAAAAALGLPKSSVSRSLRRLEDDLGVTLLTRSQRGSAVTEAGRAFYAAAARAISDVEDARQALTGAATVPRGLVRVAAPVDIGSWALMPVVARFLAAHPEVEVDVRLTNHPLENGLDAVDLVLHRGRYEDETLDSRELGSSDAALFAAPSYLARRGSPRDPADLARHACILMGRRGERERWGLIPEDGSISEPISVDVGGPVRVDATLGVRAAAAAGLGIAQLPIAGAPDDPAGSGLQRVLPGYMVRGEPLRLSWARSRHVPLRVALLREAIAESLARSCPRPAGQVADDASA